MSLRASDLRSRSNFVNCFKVDHHFYRDLIYDLDLHDRNYAVGSGGHDVYDFLKGFYFDNLKIVGKNDSRLAPEKIIFHIKYGWSIYANDQVVFLGKLIPSLGSSILIGGFTYLSGINHIWGPGTLSIGRYSSIGHGNVFYTVNDAHPQTTSLPINIHSNPRCDDFGLTFLNPKYENSFIERRDNRAKEHVCIGNVCWIGRDTKIKSRITIADGAYVAENSYVNKSINSVFSLNAGIPCRFIRNRLSSPYIQILQSIRWWNLNPQDIASDARLIHLIENAY